MVEAAVVIFAEMESQGDRARVVKALQTAREFKEAGDDVEIIFDGGGVTSAVAVANPEDQMCSLYAHVEDKVSGVCRYCSKVFDVYDQAEELGLPFLAEYHQHPSLRIRVVDGYQVITF
ncbi:MAG: hypothetical protein U5K99_01945 [Anaerolineales bacterium]|nr:hypothetical protein [Anaerolineales bacterium]